MSNKKYQNYSYSHTIQINQQVISSGNAESDDLDDLFKIGNRSIIQKQKQQDSNEIKQKKQQNNEKSSSDDEIQKIRKRKQIKKQKKDKKDKKQKKVKKQRKEKKQKRKKQQIIDISSSQMEQTPKNMIESNAMEKLQQKMDLLTKYQKELTNYRIYSGQESLNKQFGLKQKIAQNTLPIDTIKFGMPELYTYGLQDRQIPFYKRNPMLNYIIGMEIQKNSRKKSIKKYIKNKRKMQKLIRQLNIITHQVAIDWNKYENKNEERYFHYSGYQKLQGIMPERYIFKQDPKNVQVQKEYEENILQNQLVLAQKNLINIQMQIEPDILFNHPLHLLQKLPTKEQKLRSINKQYNAALNMSPNNIGLWLKFLDIQDKIIQFSYGYARDRVQNQGQKIALVERKLSILEKSLEKNPLNEQLGLKYLELLQQSRKQHSLIIQTSKSLLNTNPYSQSLWNFYLNYKLSSIVDFRHSRLQEQLYEINKYLFQNRINQLKSGKEVWKIRKCGLKILDQVLRVHRLEGYFQLCTAVCCALLQFNIFCGAQYMAMGRTQRIVPFKQYWEDYSGYKLGEYFKRVSANDETYIQHSWEGYEKGKLKQQTQINREQNTEQGYIGNYFYKPSKNSSTQKPTLWLPSHTSHNAQQIQKSPESFILFEDIESYLQTFQNSQNWQVLCSIVMNNLNMPQIFGTGSGYITSASAHLQQKQSTLSECQHIINWMKNTMVNKPNKYSPYTRHSCNIWNWYWHPELTQQFLNIHEMSMDESADFDQLNRFIYSINIVECIYRKLHILCSTEQMSPIRQYLMFLYGTLYYLHHKHTECSKDHLTHLVQLFPKQYILSRIQHILTEQPNNMILWTMYIQYQYYTSNKIQDCINCYTGCLSTVVTEYKVQQQKLQSIIDQYTNDGRGEINSQKQMKQKIKKKQVIDDVVLVKKLEVVYWLSQLLYRYSLGGNDYFNKECYRSGPINSRMILFNILRQVLLSSNPKQHENITINELLLLEEKHLDNMQKLLIGNKLKGLLKSVSSSQCWSMLGCSNSSSGQYYTCIIYYILLEIGQSPSTIVPLLLQIGSKNSQSRPQISQFAINILVDFGFLDFAHYTQLNLLTGVITNMKIVTQFAYSILAYSQGALSSLYQLYFKDYCANIRKYLSAQKQSNQNNYYQVPSNNQLFMWLLIMRILQPEHKKLGINIEKQFTQYFTWVGRNKIRNTKEPVSLQLLNILLMSPEYSYSCINQYPYCRQLYWIAAMSEQNTSKIGRLVLEKQIRLKISEKTKEQHQLLNRVRAKVMGLPRNNSNQENGMK